MEIENNDRVLIQKRWKHTVVFTDVLQIGGFNESGKEVPEHELLPGELSAEIFSVGCHIVRSAQRVYRIRGLAYIPEQETPADKDETELVRKDMVPHGTAGIVFSAWRDKLRVAHEISARHNDSPEGKFAYLCRATEACSGRWKEHIRAIYSVKESEFVPDEYASLMICLTFVGDSRCFDTWYKFDPTGKIATLR